MQPVSVLSHPLTGASLIEASAGTGKTWTIAALYLRLILGIGEEGHSSRAPLGVRSILVMTFSRAATRELIERIQKELQQAADCFSMNIEPGSAATYSDFWTRIGDDASLRRAAALRLRMAAECMDESAVMTIDAWCQRMLREHAFASGAGFDEEVLENTRAMTEEAFQDVWRWLFYGERAGFFAETVPEILDWKMETSLKSFEQYCLRQDLETEGHDALSPEMPRHTLLNALEALLQNRRKLLESSIQGIEKSWLILSEIFNNFIQMPDWPFNGNMFKKDKIIVLVEKLNHWCTLESSLAQRQVSLCQIVAEFKNQIKYLHPDAWAEVVKTKYKAKNDFEVPAALSQFAKHVAVACEDMNAIIEATVHAAAYRHRQIRKQAIGRWSFNDVQRRLLQALQHSDELVRLIRQQFPVALIDEYQDTSQIQYQIFKKIYPNQEAQDEALVLIGDPKQSIYRFRGADVHAYLQAKADLSPERWFSLPNNYRSTDKVVSVVNDLFGHAEQNPQNVGGAFREGSETQPEGVPGQGSLLSFNQVRAAGVKVPAYLQTQPSLQICWLNANFLLSMNKVRPLLAEHAANAIQCALNEGVLAEDVAVLVRQKSEADLVLKALRKRGVAAVYLSERDSVWAAEIAVDLFRWLQAAAEPQNLRHVRAAVACTLTALSVPEELHTQLHDEHCLERWMNWFLELQQRWLRQGVLAMLTYAIQSISQLNPGWFHHADAERWLTDVQHLAELAQEASVRLQGMAALLLWFQKQIVEEGQGDQGVETRTIRLEREEKQVRVLTIHKSKGLEFACVFIPFAVMYKKSTEQAGDEAKKQEQEQELMLKEDIRLLYVALTRAKYALWLGLADQKYGRANGSIVPKTALGHLLGLSADANGQAILDSLEKIFKFDDTDRILRQFKVEEGIKCQHSSSGQTEAEERTEPNLIMPRLQSWQLSSYSRLLQQVSELGLQVRKDPDEPLLSLADGGELPAGRLFGSRLHQVMELWARKDFAAEACQPVVERCFQRTPWVQYMDRLVSWLSSVAQVRLPDGASLGELKQETFLPEMEFHINVPKKLSIADLDKHCRSGLLEADGDEAVVAIETLQHASLCGMLTGVMDLVYVWQGRYWIVDYKTNRLSGYKRSVLLSAAAEHRYDVQAALYLLALHRHLRLRLKDYDPERHLGGYLLWFVRGHDHQGCGCLDWRLNGDWLSRLEGLMPDRLSEEVR